MRNQPKPRPPDRIVRKPYAPPRLKIYGDIRRLTLAFGTGDMNDGGINMTGKDKS